jgi:hypothetical protein
MKNSEIFNYLRMKMQCLSIACFIFFCIPVFAEEVATDAEGAVSLENREKRERKQREQRERENETQSSIIYNGSPYNFIFTWKKKATQSHWSGIGFAFSQLDGLEGVDLKLGKSYSIILNLGDYTIPLSHHWLLFTGFGLDFTRHHFKGNVGLEEIYIHGQERDRLGEYVAGFVPDFDHHYKSSKLQAYYITIPLLWEYQTKITGNKMFYINGGVEGLIKYYSKSQIDIRTERSVEKVKYRDLNIRPLNFRFVLRIGLTNNVGIFGYYQPIPMFEFGKGPQIKPYGIGIAIN